MYGPMDCISMVTMSRPKPSDRYLWFRIVSSSLSRVQNASAGMV